MVGSQHMIRTGRTELAGDIQLGHVKRRPDKRQQSRREEQPATEVQPVPSLKVTISSVPNETTVVLLDQKGRS